MTSVFASSSAPNGLQSPGPLASAAVSHSLQPLASFSFLAEGAPESQCCSPDSLLRWEKNEKETCIFAVSYSGVPAKRGLAASCKGSLSGAFATLDITGEGEVSRPLRRDEALSSGVLAPSLLRTSWLQSCSASIRRWLLRLELTFSRAGQKHLKAIQGLKPYRRAGQQALEAEGLASKAAELPSPTPRVVSGSKHSSNFVHPSHEQKQLDPAA